MIDCKISWPSHRGVCEGKGYTNPSSTTAFFLRRIPEEIISEHRSSYIYIQFNDHGFFSVKSEVPVCLLHRTQTETRKANANDVLSASE